MSNVIDKIDTPELCKKFFQYFNGTKKINTEIKNVYISVDDDVGNYIVKDGIAFQVPKNYQLPTIIYFKLLFRKPTQFIEDILKDKIIELNADRIFLESKILKEDPIKEIVFYDNHNLEIIHSSDLKFKYDYNEKNNEYLSKKMHKINSSFTEESSYKTIVLNDEQIDYIKEMSTNELYRIDFFPEINDFVINSDIKDIPEGSINFSFLGKFIHGIEKKNLKSGIVFSNVYLTVADSIKDKSVHDFCFTVESTNYIAKQHFITLDY